MGRSDANKKGDLLDLIKWQMGVQAERDQYDVVDDYPETVQKTLKLFIQYWMLPERAIPSKNKTAYGQWIEELDALYNLCGEKIEEAMKIGFEKYNAFSSRSVVSHPLAIKSYLISALSDININERTKKTIEKNKETITKADEKAIKDTAKKLKNLFEE